MNNYLYFLLTAIIIGVIVSLFIEWQNANKRLDKIQREFDSLREARHKEAMRNILHKL